MNPQAVSIQLVNSAELQDAFRELPQMIYSNDQRWVPPSQNFQRQLLFEKSHPFNENGTCCCWIAMGEEGRAVGRLVAIVNHAYLQHQKDDTGFFGFFECVDNSHVAGCLLDEASNWLKAQGIRRIRGPVNPSVHYEAGLLTTQHDPFFTSTYNPDYYPALLEKCGLQRCLTMKSFAVHASAAENLDPKIRQTAERVAERFKIQFRHFDMDRIERDLRRYFDLYNQTFQSMWSFNPIPAAEIEHEIQWLREIIVPELTVIAEVENRTVGAALGVLNYNPLLRQNEGQLPTGNRATFERSQAEIREARMFSSLVTPEYAMWGLGPSMMMFMLPAGLKRGVEYVESSWVESTNLLSQQTLIRAGSQPRAEYAFYEANI